VNNRDEFSTAGEILLGRRLEIEMRAGVEHFKVGQTLAEIVGDDAVLTASLSFVNQMGQAIIIPCTKIGVQGEWQPMGLCRRAGVFTAQKSAERLPAEFKLTESMLKALAEAEVRYDEKLKGDKDG
jgi:hypothetical protein